jgi:hypothetical protein
LVFEKGGECVLIFVKSSGDSNVKEMAENISFLVV